MTRQSDKTRRNKKAKVCILTAILVILLAMPAFATNETDEKAVTGEEDSAVTEEFKETDEQADDAAPANDIEEIKEDAGAEEDSEENGAEAVNEEEPEEKTAEEEPVPVETPPAKREPVMLKASSSDNVSYSAKRVGSNAGETSVFSVTSGGKTYTGACAEQGVTMKSSGQATITKIDNSTKIAKVIYYYAIALGSDNWWTGDHKTDKVGKILGMDHADDTDVTKRRMVECFCQIYNMGSSDWYKTVTSSSGGGWSTGTADKVRDYYKNIDTSSISVPAGFEIWYAKSGSGAQSFIMWAYMPEGYVTMTKVSGNTNITN
jgi:hypothetical protein